MVKPVNIASWCKLCRAVLENKRRREKGIVEKKLSSIENGKKLCLHCNIFLDLSAFSPSKKGIGGVSSYCRECFVKRHPNNKTKAVERTSRYRKRHRERYLASHRIHQFKRKYRITIADDGTITDEFLIDLYSTEVCYICNEKIPVENRTADHVIPLAKGGGHSAYNLKMACKQCNSSKGAK